MSFDDLTEKNKDRIYEEFQQSLNGSYLKLPPRERFFEEEPLKIRRKVSLLKRLYHTFL